MDRPYRVCIVGAGFISETHIEVLKGIPSVELAAVVDRDSGRADAIAAKSGIPEIHASVEDMLARGGCDVAHVLVPPDLHRSVAAPLLEAGVHVFLEKPMAVSTAECRALMASAEKGRAYLGVNQNFLFDPAFLKLKTKIGTGDFGKLHHLQVWLNLPLRQLTAGQFGHWMFRLPQNIVLEQAVHPLSQAFSLAGPLCGVETTVGKPLDLASGVEFFDSWQISMICARATVQLFLSFGQGMPAWGMTAICDDGVLSADFLGNRVTIQKKSRWPDFYDSFLGGIGSAASNWGQSWGNAAGYVLSTLKLRPRSDTFFLGMKGSIEAFYAGLPADGPAVDGAFGTAVIDMCERIATDVAADVATDVAADGESVARTVEPGSGRHADVAVLGGTGFIGRHVVKRLLAAGLRVRVMARSTRILPPMFEDPGVEVISGDTTSARDVGRAVAGARIVIDLAPGGGGATWAELERNLVGSARTVATCCLENKVERLIYTSSIAAVYIGDADDVITGATGADPRAERRGIYARAKAVAEQMLTGMHEKDGLPLCILRPGVVIGEGGLPFHSGLGVFVRELHCIGWNQGDNALPFVLAEDVASAIHHAIDAEGVVGRCYNIVGDVRFTAREYTAELARVLGRPLVFHPRPVVWLQLVEIGKWLIKLAIGRSDNPFPSYRDLASRGMKARFDCADAKTDLNWTPVSDRREAVDRGIEVYGQPK